MQSEPRPRTELGMLASQISREIVRVHARLYGRGPTRAKTFLGEDYALCVLEDVFTRAEQTLIEAGNTAQVQSSRLAFQEAVEDEFTAIVEVVTGRKVKAFVSQIHIASNLAVEVFLFEPRPEERVPGRSPREGEL